MTMKLYTFWRSSSAWRVRAALAYKGVACEHVAVDISLETRAQHRPEFGATNPGRQVPVLEWSEDGVVRRLAQSVAIIEYLEERFPEPPLLPVEPYARARARQLVEVINAGTQPFQNNGFMAELAAAGVDDRAWARRAIGRGLATAEALLAETMGAFAVGDALSIADLFLAPQLFNARGFRLDFGALPRLAELEAVYAEHPALVASHPSRQPDAPQSYA